MKKVLAFIKAHGAEIIGGILLLMLCASFVIPLLVVIARVMWYLALV